VIVLLGLLLVALACLVVGLLLANAIWLVGSLVISGLAGYLLWRQRERGAARAGDHKNQAAPKTTATARALVTGKAFATSPRANPDQKVWVIDGQPAFHDRECAAIQNLEAQQIPHGQALEDGFAECTVCKPVAAANAPEHVWVVDGRPDYHLEDCRSLKIAAAQCEGQGEKITRTQAVGDGFSPCPDCSPDGTATRDAGSPSGDDAAAATTVWVIDGRPRYHLADCLIIKDQDVEEIPLEQATEDGFMACSMCAPQAAVRSPAGS
jgi:hypothetical protein